MREATRNEDMSARGRLRLMQQTDGDIIIAVQSEENGLIQRGDSVEFCAIGAGGGRSPRTLAALRALMDAIDQDNADSPISCDSPRAAPIAAQLDAELPAPDVYDGDGPMLAPNTAYSAAKVREIVAPYAERIRLLERAVEVLAAERDRARAQYDHTFKVMMSVYNLAPNTRDISLPDGRVMRFNDPNSAETLSALGKAIWAIPEQLRIDGRTAGTASIEPCDLIVAKVRVFGEGVGFQDARLSILKKLDGKPLYAKAADLIAAAPSPQSPAAGTDQP